MTDDAVHLLILGSPRSGTTLLSAMLGCHSDIALLNEDRHGASLTIFSKKIKGVKLCVPNQIELEQTIGMHIVDIAITTMQILINPLRKCLGFRVPIIRGRKSKYSIAEYQKQVSKLFVFGIVRSPHDSIKSIMGRGQQTRKTAEYRWRRIVEVLYDIKKGALQNTELCMIEFDTLVKEPEITMTKLLQVLGCSFEPAVLEGFKHTPQYQGRDKISSGKASQGIDHALTHPLLKRDEGLKDKYLYLVDSCI